MFSTLPYCVSHLTLTVVGVGLFDAAVGRRAAANVVREEQAVFSTVLSGTNKSNLRVLQIFLCLQFAALFSIINSSQWLPIVVAACCVGGGAVAAAAVVVLDWRRPRLALLRKNNGTSDTGLTRISASNNFPQVVLLIVGSATCAAHIALGIVEDHARVFHSSGAYYGWSVGAAVLPLLPLMAGLAGKKLACTLLGSKHLVIGLFAMTCAVTWLLWSQRVTSQAYTYGSWLMVAVQVLCVETVTGLEQSTCQTGQKGTAQNVPSAGASKAQVVNPKQQPQEHMTATEAPDGGINTHYPDSSQATSETGRMSQEFVEAPGFRVQLTDALAVFRCGPFTTLHSLHCGESPAEGCEGMTPDSRHRLPFKSGPDIDRKWSTFTAELGLTTKCKVLSSYGHQHNVPISELLDGFQDTYALPEQQDKIMTMAMQLVQNMLGTPYMYPPSVGYCPVSICSQSMSHNLHQQAYADIISKLQQGYAKQLWQTIPKGGAKSIAHPVLPAQHTTEADLIACIRAAAVTPVHPALGRQAADLVRMLREPLLALASEVEHGEVTMMLVPRAALVQDCEAEAPLRVWGAIADKQVRSHPAASSPVQTTDPSASLLTKISITGDGLQSTAVRPSRFRFYVDDNCRDVAEVLLHAWLKLQGLPAGVCHLAEALLAKRCPDKGLQLPHRIKQEVASMAPMQLAEALVQTAMSDQADRPDPNDAHTVAPSQRSSGSVVNTFAEQQGSCSRTRDDVILDKANGVMDNVAALWCKHDLQSLAHVQARDIAQLLTALCLDDTVDLTWMQRTKSAWKMAVRRSIQQQNAHIAAKSASPLFKSSSEASDFGAADKPSLTLEAVVEEACKWMQKHKCVTTGTISVLRQVQRVNFELTTAALLESIVVESNHDEFGFVSDVDIITVYLEHMGIANELEEWFGLPKFRVGRVLWNELCCRRQQGKSEDESDPVKVPDAKQGAISPDSMSGFGQSIGNGLFWLAPFILYFVPLAVSGFSLFDNGHLQNGFERWLFWAFFSTYLIVGGYFNLLIHYINNHKWRFSSQAQLLAIAQSVVSSVLVLMACAVPVGGYAWARGSWTAAWFAAVAFLLLAMELTMLLMVASLTADGNVWGSSSAVVVLALYIVQVCFNAVSHHVTASWGNPIAQNLVGLLVFAVLSAGVLYLHVRKYIRVWAEALSIKGLSNPREISYSARQLLMSFHNAVNGTSIRLDCTSDAELCSHLNSAASVLLGKTKVLRRQRLPLIFDLYAWVTFQGALTHMMITIPYWLSEWAGGGYLNDVHVKVMVVTLGYVMLGGAFCEWCWIVKGRAQGANNKRMAAIYRTQFKRLMRWCLLMGMFCFAVLIFLITARGNITSIRGYIQVCVDQYVQFIWFPMKLAGYTCMIIVRFDVILGSRVTKARTDVLCMLLALSASIGLALPLAKVYHLDYVPPIAVATAGTVYLAMHFLGRLTQREQQPQASSGGQKNADKALNSATGQHALSNTSARQSHLVAMVQTLPNFSSQMLTPTQKLGKQVAEQLQRWQYAGNQCAFGASQDSVSPSRQYLMHFFEAYPEAQEVMAAVEEAWQMGTLEVWLLPPAAINGCKQAPQFGSVGVCDGGKLKVYVVVDEASTAPACERSQTALAQRIAESVIGEAAVWTWTRAGQEASMSRCRLNACHWERSLNPAGLLPARICNELNSLPAPVLHCLVQDTPLCLISALMRQLGAVPAVWGQDRNKNFDVMEDMDRNVLGDAWRWLPSTTRCMLLDSAAALAHLAVSAHKQDEASCAPSLAPPTAPRMPSTGNQIGSTEGSSLFMADEQNDMAARRSCSSSVAASVASSVPQALHSMAHQLADSCQAVCSPLLTAMEIVNLGKTISEPFADCGHVLSDTAFSIDLSSNSSTSSFPSNSPSESADTYLYILLMRAYLAAGMAVTVCDQACHRICSLAAGSGSLSGDTALLIDVPDVQPSTQSELPLAAMGLLSSMVCVAHAAVRLSWIAVMGDVAFWQEAAYIMSRPGHTTWWNKLLRAPMFAMLSLLQLIAALSRAAHLFLCHAVLWDFDGLWQWLMVARDAPVAAIACYGSNSQLQEIIAIQRQGIFYNHICLPDCQGALAQPTREFTDLLTDSEYLANCQTVLCWTTPSMTTPEVGDAITACTAFMVRSSGSSHVDFLTALLARLPGQTHRQQLARAHATWLPIWQFNAVTHTCSLWKYRTLEDSVPHQCFTWTGISSLEHAQDVLTQFHEPVIVISYDSTGVVQEMKVGGPGACTTAQVSFKSLPDRPPQEAATAVAQCLVQKHQPGSASVESAVDDAVDVLEGKYSIQILYHVQDASSAKGVSKVAPSLVPLQVFVTERDNTFASWKLLCNPLPSSLEHYQYLWPSESKDVLQCFHKATESDSWQSRHMPMELQNVLQVLRVPYSPSVWQEAPYLPRSSRLTGPAESVSLTQLGHRDTGLSRLFLWWVWNQGLPPLQQRLKPRVRRSHRAYVEQKIAALQRWLCSLLHIESESAAYSQKRLSALPQLDGLTATMMDEALLMREPLLRHYWSSVARFSQAHCEDLIKGNIDAVQAAIGSNMLQLPATFSQLAHSVHSLAALNTVPGNSYSYARPSKPQLTGGVTSSALVAPVAPPSGLGKLNVLGLDTGTWPMDGGGVATCRELVLDYVSDVTWRVNAEIGNDYKKVVPAYVAHESLDSVNLLIMWDSQSETLAQGTLSHVACQELARQRSRTTASNIVQHLKPALEVLLMVMLKPAHMSLADMHAFAGAMVQFHNYFTRFDWESTWASSVVSTMFMNALQAMSHMSVGRAASFADLKGTYDMMQHYLKALTMPAPRQTQVCHASHHGTQALGGLVCKRQEQKALVIWDHCVYLRERLLWSDSSEPNIPHLTREALARLHRASACVLYKFADLVVPCCATFNVGWEMWLGRPAEGILPVLNGLDVTKYPVVPRNEYSRPTAVMLSHVYGAKDIVTAIKAAQVIITQYGVSDYQLLVYGSKTHDAKYCKMCEELIVELKLQDNVKIMGLGKPTKILPTGWVYLQSSVTEGLPVSILEAGLSGVCVVCTDVGGCSELLRNGTRSFGRLTSAKNVQMIAYGQLEVMAMLPSLEILKLQQPPELDLDHLQVLLHDPQVQQRRQEWGQEYREFILSRFSISVHAMQQRQALYLSHFSQQRRNERKNELMRRNTTSVLC